MARLQAALSWNRGPEMLALVPFDFLTYRKLSAYQGDKRSKTKVHSWSEIRGVGQEWICAWCRQTDSVGRTLSWRPTLYTCLQIKGFFCSTCSMSTRGLPFPGPKVQQWTTSCKQGRAQGTHQGHPRPTCTPSALAIWLLTYNQMSLVSWTPGSFLQVSYQAKGLLCLLPAHPPSITSLKIISWLSGTLMTPIMLTSSEGHCRKQGHGHFLPKGVVWVNTRVPTLV